MNLLKNGGTLVYSTCTFLVEENEGLVSWALKRFPCLQLCKQVCCIKFKLEEFLISAKVYNFCVGFYPSYDLKIKMSRSFALAESSETKVSYGSGYKVHYQSLTLKFFFA